MPSFGRLLTAAIVTLVVGLVIQFPARVAVAWFAPADIAVSGIEGSVWSGSARAADAGGLYLSDLSWQLRPAGLFKGRLSYAIEARPGDGRAAAVVELGVGGAVAIRELDAVIGLAAIATQARVPGLRGTASASFERIELNDGVPVAADGTVEVRGLLVPQIAQQSIGAYRAEFFTQQEGIVASVEDSDGAVDLAGRLSIRPDRSYEFLGQLAPKPETPASLREQMRFLGTANARGQYELRLEGQL